MTFEFFFVSPEITLINLSVNLPFMTAPLPTLVLFSCSNRCANIYSSKFMLPFGTLPKKNKTYKKKSQSFFDVQ